MQDTRRAYQATKLTLASLFVARFVGFISRKHGPSDIVRLRPLDFGLLGLATFRLGRMLAYDKVAEPLREPFTRTTVDSYGAAQTVEPAGRGMRRALGELLACPICVGTWIAAGLVYGMHLLPGPTRLFMTIMGTIGLGEVLNALTEALQWTGEEARARVGLEKRQ